MGTGAETPFLPSCPPRVRPLRGQEGIGVPGWVQVADRDNLGGDNYEVDLVLEHGLRYDSGQSDSRLARTPLGTVTKIPLGPGVRDLIGGTT